tara:strand:+ start:266 stop:445 length:180 start_codon:yes stop_codon:yes gene_type:complete
MENSSKRIQYREKIQIYIERGYNIERGYKYIERGYNIERARSRNKETRRENQCELMSDI